MSNEAILRSLYDMHRECAYAQLESDYIERYLQRNDADMLIGVTDRIVRTNAADTRIHFAPNLTQGGTSFASSGPRESQLGTVERNSSYLRRTARGYASSLVGFSGNVGGGGGGDSGGGGFGGGGSSFDTDAMSLASAGMSMSNASMRTVDSLGMDTGVNYTMKLELVDKDYAGFVAQIEVLRSNTKAELRDVTAELEEMRLSSDEAVETLREFRDFVMVKGRQPGARGTVPLERCLKFFDKWMIHGNGMVERMRLQTATLRQDIGVKEKALAIKAEMSGILKPVDFEELSIQRRSYELECAEKDAHLLGLKRVTGNVALALTTQRKLLEKSKSQLAAIERKTEVAKRETDRFDKMRETVEDEIEMWSERVDKLQERKNTYKAPSTMEYMEAKMRLDGLVREVKMLLRQEKIAQIKDKEMRLRVRKKWAAVKEDEKRVVDQQREHSQIVDERRSEALCSTASLTL